MFFPRRISSTYQSLHGLLLVAILSVGCAPGIHVQTATAPDANLSGARTYRFLHRAERAVAGNPAQSTNPLIESPIVAEEIQRDVTDELNMQGYTLQPDMADLSVAFYGSVQRRLEVTDYDYGYPF